MPTPLKNIPVSKMSDNWNTSSEVRSYVVVVTHDNN
jgi:hypothetical protein